MKKQFLTKLSLLVCLVALVVLACALAVSAETYSGYCGGEGDGTNLTWTLDTETGVLEIEGEGEMKRFEWDERAPWYSYRRYITSAYICNGVTTVGSDSFEECYSLVSVRLPDGLELIENSAFSRCTSLENINFPEGLETIESYAFYECVSLDCVAFPSTLSYLDDYAFRDCDGIETITVNADNPVYHSNGNCLIETDSKTLVLGCQNSVIPNDGSVEIIGDYAFYGCAKLEKIVIPQSVEIIGEEAFNECFKLKELTLNEGLKSIGISAFSECKSLKYVKLPDSVTTLGAFAFSYCDGLYEFIIGDGVTELPDDLFYYGQYGLSKLTIGANVSKIGADVFERCYDIKEIIVDPQNQYFRVYNNGLYTYDLKTLIVPFGYETCFVVPEETEIVEAEKFYLSLFSVIFMSDDVEIPDVPELFRCSREGEETTVIGHVGSTAQAYAEKYGYRFIAMSNDNVIGGELDEDVAWTFDVESGELELYGANNAEISIKGHGFEPWGHMFWDAVKSVVINDGVKVSLDYGAFAIYSSLESIYIGDSVSYVSDMAFYGSPMLDEIIVSPDNDKYCVIDNVLYSKDVTELIVIPEGKSNALVLPASVKYCDVADTGNWCGTSLSNITVEAGNQYFCSVNGILYDIDMKTLIVAPRKISGEVVIPDGVETIGESAFYDCDNITSIILPDSVTEIGNDAFYNCDSLETIDFGKGLKEIGAWAFRYCDSLKSIVLPNSLTTIKSGVFDGCENLQNVVLSEALEAIPSGAFVGCVSLESVVIPDSVTMIGDNAFGACHSLKNVVIGDAVEVIEFSAFYDSSFKTVTLPASLTNIDVSAFTGNNNLEAIYVDGDNDVYESVDGVLYRKDTNTLVLVPEGVRGVVEIADGTETIGENAFDDCEKITEIIIPDSVTTIESFAVSITNNSVLRWVTLGEGVTTISDYAFYFNNGLEEINIPDSVEYIGESAFERCYSLGEISVAEGVEFVGERAFYDCYVLKKITFESAITEIYDSADTIPEDTKIYGHKDSTAEAYAIAYDRKFVDLAVGDHECVYDQMVVSDEYKYETRYDEYNNVLYYGCVKSCECGAVPENWEDAAYFYVGNCGEEGDNVTWIYDEETYTLDISGEGAMADYAVLVEEEYGDGDVSVETETYYEYFPRPWGSFVYDICTVNIDEGITRIGADAFSCFYNITEVTIPGSVKWIGEFAFSSCENLETVNFSEGLECIYEGAFQYCCSLQDITFPSSLVKICNYAFIMCENLAEVNFNEGLRWIYDFAFRRCDLLASVELPTTVEYLGEGVFERCESLESLSVKEGNTTFHSLSNCIIRTADKLLVSGCKNSVIPADDSVTAIADYVFYNCDGLVSVVIPENITALGVGIFEDCNGIESAEILGDITYIPDYLFSECVNLGSIVLPESITHIGDYAFAGCYELDQIDIPESLEYIGEGAFMWCGSLDNVYLPEGLFEIGAEAFAYCVNLSEIEIPASVTNIRGFEDDEATKLTFMGCISMEKLTVREGNVRYHSKDNCLIETEMETLIQGIQTSEIPTDGSVGRIGYGAFACITTLDRITIPEYIYYIDECAFYGCEGLRSVSVPENVYYIGRAAFGDCESLKKIVIKSHDVFIDGEEAISDTAVIYGYKYSTAEEYADEYDREFVVIPDDDEIVHVTIESKDALSGNLVEVKVSLDKRTTFKSMLIENIACGSDVLDLVDVYWELEDAAIASWSWDEGSAVIAFEDEVTVKGDVLTLVFAVSDEFEGDVRVSADVFVNRRAYEGGDEPMFVEVTDGVVSVYKNFRGDVNGDGFVDSNDAIYLLRYTLNNEGYPINQSGDMDGNGVVESNDAIYLLRFTLNPDRYPLK